MELDTTSPGLQFYTGNRLKSANPILGKNGVAYPQYSGFAEETPVSITTPRSSLHMMICHPVFAQACLLSISSLFSSKLVSV